MTSACRWSSVATCPVLPKTRIMAAAGSEGPAPRAPRSLLGKMKERSFRRSQPFPYTVAALQDAPPVLVVEIPAHCAPQPFLQRHRGPPAQLTAHPRRVDRIAQVMPGTVGDETDQPVMRCACGHHLVHQGADHADKVDIARLGLAADIVGPA